MYPNRNQESATGKTRDIWPWDTENLLQTEGQQYEVTGKSRQTTTTRRKVIKLDHDRYQEADVKQKSRKSERGYGTEQGADSRGITKKPYQTNGDLDLIIPDRKEEHRKVIDSTRQKLRGVNTEGSYLDNVPPSQSISQNSIGDLTDSRALRETEIRFLNSQAPTFPRDNVKKNREPKLTYVDVPFPGQHSNNVYSNHHGNKDIPVNMDSGGAESSDQNNRIRRKKRGLIADLPENNDILTKLKERIRQQQLNASSSDTSSRDDSLLEHGQRQSQHVLHDQYDPVSMRPGANCDGMDKPVMTRKIAAGPIIPPYKGFTDVGTSDSKQSSRPVSQSTPVLVKKKIKKPPPSVHIQPRKYEMYGTEYPSSGESGMSSTEKPKKTTRVVSTERKNPNEIITTSSWRAGQELVRQKLGPLRTKKTSGDSQRKDVVQPEEQRRPDGAEGHDLWQHVGSNNTGTLGKDRPKPKGTVAEETQKILDGLNIDRETSDEDGKKSTKHDRGRPAVKRKAPKQTELEKQSSAAAKQRHYDPEAVRKYIAKQKADRQRKKKEEEENQMNESERKKRHLEELYNKQKSSTQKSQKVVKTKPRSQKTRRTASDETHDRKRIVSGGSDKENNYTQNTTGGHELEDDSDTLTGNSDEETTPVGTPREEKKKSREPEKREQMAAMKPSLDPKLHINLDDAFARFSKVVEKRAQAGPESYPVQDIMSQDVEVRKQAIKDMASSLRNRLHEISAPGSSGVNANGQQTAESSRSRVAFQAPVAGTSQEKKEYTSRYDRLIGRNSDVFSNTTHLPGTRELDKRAREVLEDNYQKEAAIRIQSAYRGHSARRSLDLSSQSAHHPDVDGATGKHKSKTRHHTAENGNESDVSDSSTFSEVTRTDQIDEDSLNLLPQRTSKSQDKKYSNDKRQPPVGGACYVPPNKYKWEEPKADPYSVMNVLNRKSKLGKDAYTLTPLEQQIRDTVNQTVLPADSGTSSRASSHHYTASLPVVVNNESNLRPSRSSSRGQSDDDSVRSSVSRGTSLRSATKEPMKENNVKSYQETSGKYTNDSDATDTDDSYSNLVPDKMRSEEWLPLRQDSELSVNREKTSKQERPKQQRSEEWMPLRQDSDVSVASEKSANQHEKRVPPTTSTNYQNINRAETGRYSPNSLDRQMMAELNRLESLEESYCQLAGVERTRAVSLAQQESVSLAQVLKSRQMAQDLEMKRLQLQAQQEAQASNQQLNDIRLRTQGSAYRSPYHSGFSVEPMLHSTPASKVNDAYKKRSDVPTSQSVSETAGRRSARERTDTDVSDSISARKNRDLSKISSSGSYSSRPKHSRSATTSSVVTAKDSRLDSDSSSIKSVSDADAQDLSKTESIQEDIQDDYTLSFDDSITEDESFRQVLPSESHRKELKRRQTDDSFMQDDAGTSQLSIGDVSMSSLFVGGDTFSKFTADMVRQMMKEEELRAQHQAAMLRIRETALKKKAEAELSWLRQQKRHLRDKGADDVHPQIKKKEKIVLRELHEKQDEIRRLQEANLQTSRERQNVLKQQEAIAKAHQKKRMTKLQEGLKKLTGRLGRPSDIHTEDEASVLDDASDINEDISAKEYKSDSELYGDKSNNKVSKSDKKKIDKKQQLWLNDKYLTKREIKLLSRKKNAEELLAWKKHLDDQEAEVFEMEKKALDAWQREGKEEPKKAKKSEKSAEKKTERKADHVEPGKATKASKSKPPARTESESIISEQISTAKDDSYSTSHVTSRDIRPKTVKDEVKSRSPKRSGSDMSIPEEVQSRTSSSVTPDNKQKVNDSSDDTIVNSSVNEEYTNDTFEETTASRSKRKPLSRYLPSGSPLPSPWSRRTGSESESEDSISHTDTVSDTSDYEGRIRHLNDELRRRRKECDLLKKARKARKKEKLKAQEESLKKQVEAYDNYINQLKHEQSDLELEPNKSVVKPLIKHPKSKARQEEITPTRQRDTEGSFSSSYEDTVNGSDSAQNSPNLSDSRETSKTSPLVDKKSFLDRISEGSESEKSAPKLAQKPDVKETHSQSSVSEVIEELSEGSEVTKTESGILKLDIGKATLDDEVDNIKGDDDASYSMDFTASASSLHTNLKPSLSARSDKSISRILSPRDDSRISEVIEEAISVQSDVSKSAKLDLEKPKEEIEKSEAEKSVSHAVTGIQESDSETDSHAKSHHTLSYSPTASRPSSGTERSVASSYGVNFEDEESERTVESESESEKTPVRLPAQVHSQTSKVASQVSEEDISEHISVSLPSLSEKKPASQRDELANKDLDDLLGGVSEDELTPREATPLIGDDDNSALLLTDPLAEFQITEPVLVWGRKKGKLLYKGKVDFAPGVWAGVELEQPDEDQDDVCQKYFDCRQGHGVLVAGSDISTVPEGMKFDIKPTADDSLTSQEEGSATDSDLEKAIKDAAQNVQHFDKKPEQRDVEALADKLTNEIAAEIIVDSVETMEGISNKQQKKAPPPTLPKPKKKPTDADVSLQKEASESPKSEKATDDVMNKLLENAITQMIDIRNKKKENNQLVNGETPLINVHLSSSNNQSDLEEMLKDDVQRPGTPNLALSRTKEVEQLDKDLLDLLGGEEDDDDDYFEETLGVNNNKSQQAGIIQALREEDKEIVYAVPHEKSEVEAIINDSIDIYWNCRRCGEPFTDVTPPDSFLKTDQSNLSMESKSKKTYKKMLFELTGEIICDIYSQEEEVVLQPWEKPKRRRQQYFKGYAPPTTVDNLRPIVHKAVDDILGVNGTRKADRVKNKFNIRKKKDNVDNILTLQLREEEPDWIDYNADELDVKNALADSIFEVLLAETVDTCSKIHEKKHKRVS